MYWEKVQRNAGDNKPRGVPLKVLPQPSEARLPDVYPTKSIGQGFPFKVLDKEKGLRGGVRC